MIDTLVNIPYLWGSFDINLGTDCFGLAQYCRFCFDAKPIKSFMWVYEDVKSENELPKDLAGTLCKKYASQPRINSNGFYNHLDLLCLRSNSEELALGTYLIYGGLDFACFMTRGGSIVLPFYKVRKFLHSVWNPALAIDNNGNFSEFKFESRVVGNSKGATQPRIN